jgi:hypothetical protein
VGKGLERQVPLGVSETVNGKTQFSRLGIASCVLGVFVWIYYIAAIFVFFYTDLLKSFNSLGGTSRSGQVVSGFEGLLEAILLLIFLYVVVPFAGFGLGLILGLAGCIQQKRKRVFAVIGLPVNALFFLFLVIVLLGLNVPK